MAKSKKKLRRCLRCGCTDARACAGGCTWLHSNVDVCSSCLLPGELPLIQTLLAFDNTIICMGALRKPVRPLTYGRLNFELLAASSNLIARLNQRGRRTSPMNTHLDSYIAGVQSMAERAARLHGPLHSMEHGHGLLLEELDEYFDEIRKKEEKRDYELVAFECIDIGVCALRMLIHEGLDPERKLDQIENHILNNPTDQPLHAFYSMLLGLALGAPVVSRNRWDLSNIEAIIACAGSAYLRACQQFAAKDMITKEDHTAIDQALAEIKQPGFKLVCAYCRAQLPGSDPQGPRTSHGVCTPFCPEARAAGFEDAPSQPSTLNSQQWQ